MGGLEKFAFALQIGPKHGGVSESSIIVNLFYPPLSKRKVGKENRFERSHKSRDPGTSAFPTTRSSARGAVTLFFHCLYTKVCF